MISRKFAAGVHFGPVDKWLLQREVFSKPARSTRKITHQICPSTVGFVIQPRFNIIGVTGYRPLSSLLVPSMVWSKQTITCSKEIQRNDIFLFAINENRKFLKSTSSKLNLVRIFRLYSATKSPKQQNYRFRLSISNHKIARNFWILFSNLP